MKKILQRTCIACNTKKDKKDLIRIVKKKNGIIEIDKEGKVEGRGAYICENIECLDKLKKNKKLEKAFSIKIEPNFYEILRGVIIDR